MTKQDVTSFRDLVRWIAAEYHSGKFYPIAGRVGVSAGLVDQWKRGAVKRPSIDSVTKLCRAYDLNASWVLSLVLADYHAMAEALSRPPRKRRGAAVVLLALSLMGVGASSAPRDKPLHTATSVRQGAFCKVRRRIALRMHNHWACRPVRVQPVGV